MSTAFTLTWFCALALSGAVLTHAANGEQLQAAAEEAPPYVLQVDDVTAKVGEPATMRVTLKIHDGYEILTGYDNRVIKLSSWDDGVAFEHESARPKVGGDTLVFSVNLKATKPGTHAINGLFRVGYIHRPGEMAMINMPLKAKVTGTE